MADTVEGVTHSKACATAQSEKSIDAVLLSAPALEASGTKRKAEESQGQPPCADQRHKAEHAARAAEDRRDTALARGIGDTEALKRRETQSAQQAARGTSEYFGASRAHDLRESINKSKAAEKGADEQAFHDNAGTSSSSSRAHMPPNEPGEARATPPSTCVCMQRLCICHNRSHNEISSKKCDACERPGCWRANPECIFFGRAPSWHPDARPGDSVPHIRQVQWSKLPERTPGGAQVVRVEGQDFYVGEASGEGCNCLIDTLKQTLSCTGASLALHSLAGVRELLKEEFPRGPRRVTSTNFLELEHHWKKVIQFIGLLGQKNTILRPEQFRIVCVDLAFVGNGDVEGTGPTTLYIAREGASHFVPLFPYHGTSAGRSP